MQVVNFTSKTATANWLKSFLFARSILNNEAIRYIFYSFLSTGASFVKLLLFARLLSPSLFATFSLFELVASYGLYLGSLGIFESAARFVPFYLGKARYSFANEIVSFSVGSQLVLSLILLGVYFVVVFFISNYFSSGISIFLFCISGLYAFFSNLFNFTLMIVLSNGYRKEYAKFLAFKNLLSLAVGYILFLRLSISGILLAEVFVLILIVCSILNNKLYVRRIRFSIRWSKLLIYRGFYFMQNSLIQNLSRNFERLLISITLGVEIFGQFSFSIIIFSIGVAIQNLLSQFINSRILFDFGSTNSVKRWIIRIDRILVISFLISLFFYPVFLFLLNEILILYFDKYYPGINLMKIIYFSAIFNLGNLYQGVLIALNKSYLLNVHSLLVLFVSVVFCLIGWSIGASLYYFAYIFTLNRLFSLILFRVFCFKSLNRFKNC